MEDLSRYDRMSIHSASSSERPVADPRGGITPALTSPVSDPKLKASTARPPFLPWEREVWGAADGAVTPQDGDAYVTDDWRLIQSRRETPSAEVVRQLLNYLLSGRVKPGDKIPSERQLQRNLGVGRSAVREAVKSLGILGLLDVRMGDGTYLTRSTSDLLPRVLEWGLLLSEQSLEDLLEARWHIEVATAGLAASRHDTAALEELQALLDDMRRTGSDFDAYVDADVAFHLRLAEASGNKIFSSMLGNIQSLLQAWASRVIYTAGETASSLAVHEPILAAVQRGDVEAARAAMAAHSDRANRRLRESLRRREASDNHDDEPDPDGRFPK